MKKTLVLFFALFALVACNLDIAEVVETPSVGENDEIKLNVTITRTDISPDTKAAVKHEWVEGDVVFLFFDKVAAPKYVEMKRTGSSWTAKLKNSMTVENLLSSGTLTAVYLPYGSDYVVVEQVDGHRNGSSIVSKTTGGAFYTGIFYVHENCSYEFNQTGTETEKTLKANISLAAPNPVGDAILPREDGAKWVHFDVAVPSGYENHTFYMNQDFVRPLSLTSINIRSSGGNGKVYAEQHDKNGRNGYAGYAIPGYYDATLRIVSFSGLLSADAVGSEKDYSFIIHDKTNNDAYSFTANAKTISKNMYIGLGSISDDTKWTHITDKYFSVSPTKVVTFAPGNLQATYNSGSWTWGFAANQYTVLNGSGANLAFDANGNFDASLIPSGNAPTVDLFGWVGASNTTLTGVAQYGIFASSSNAAYGNGAGEQLKCDWGDNVSGSWRTPTSSNMSYLAYSRVTSGHLNTVNGVANAAYARAIVAGVDGLILFPDNYVHPSGVTLPSIINVNHGEKGEKYYEDLYLRATSYDAEQWASMETNGAVFLPSTKYRNYNGSNEPEIVNSTSEGEPAHSAVLYWLKDSPTTTTQTAYRTNVTYGGLNLNDNKELRRGFAVRLVHDLN